MNWVYSKSPNVIWCSFRFAFISCFFPKLHRFGVIQFTNWTLVLLRLQIFLVLDLRESSTMSTQGVIGRKAMFSGVLLLGLDDFPILTLIINLSALKIILQPIAINRWQLMVLLAQYYAIRLLNRWSIKIKVQINLVFTSPIDRKSMFIAYFYSYLPFCTFLISIMEHCSSIKVQSWYAIK